MCLPPKLKSPSIIIYPFFILSHWPPPTFPLVFTILLSVYEFFSQSQRFGSWVKKQLCLNDLCALAPNTVSTYAICLIILPNK